jgi:general transcription factor 3C polypeptide 1
LFHLPRFYSDRRPQILIMFTQMIKYLKEKPGFEALYEEMVSELEVTWPLKRMTRHNDFVKFFDALVVPSESLADGDQTASSPGKSRMVRVIRLKNPDVDPETAWDEQMAVEDDEAENENSCNMPGLMKLTKFVPGKTFLRQAHELLESKGPAGMSQLEIGRELGLNKLDARTVCRSLEKRNVVVTVFRDQGKQRTTIFVAKKFENDPSVTSFSKEKKKMDDRTGAPKGGKKGGQNDQEIAALKENLNFESDSPKKRGHEKLSFKHMQRSNRVVELVKQLRVIDEPYKILKHIRDSEQEEGLEGVMDKKSLLRLLVKLSEQGLIKNFFVKITDGAGKEKTKHFVCEPDVSEDHTLVQSAIEQVKMKSNICQTHRPKSRFKPNPGKVAVKNSEFEDETVGESLKEMQQALSAPNEKSSEWVYNKNLAKKYGIQPKFIRMRELHMFLFYLTRAYNGDKESARENLGQLTNKLGSLVDDQLEEDLKNFELFHSTICWQMFVSPLPAHPDWPTGWCLICDVLLRLPLSIFVRLVNVTIEVPNIEDYLGHPVRQHYLVRMLPVEMRQRLLYNRKYIFSVHEIATNLAFVGLLQFGPQKMKEKDQVFCYINTKASLRDTRYCRPSYNKIAPDDVPTNCKSYTFCALEDVETYWIDLWTLAMDTRLGIGAAGDEVVIEKPEMKTSLKHTLVPKTAENAPSFDTGETPGDSLGAAGCDSSLFCHLKRNWKWVQRDGNTPRRAKPEAPTTVVKVSTEKKRKKGEKAQIPTVKVNEGQKGSNEEGHSFSKEGNSSKTLLR